MPSRPSIGGRLETSQPARLVHPSVARRGALCNALPVRAFVRWFVVALVVCGCGDDGSEGASSGTPPDAGTTPSGCTAGFSEAEGGSGCTTVFATEPCAPGTRRAIGQAACVPVGVTKCGTGFERDRSGWGCNPILPGTTCKGMTREKIGQALCVPIGDCAAPFPPKEATHFVDPRGAVDATHFKTMKDALAAAPAKAVIAVAEGTYDEQIVPTVPVTIVGVCPEKTVFATSTIEGIGLFVNKVDGVTVKNLTIRGFGGGASAYDSTVTLEDVLLDKNFTAGAITSNAGSKLRIVRSVVRGTRARANDGTTYGVAAQRAAVLEMVDSAIVDNEMMNVSVYRDAAKGTLDHVVIRDGLARTAGGNMGKLGVGIYSSDSGETAVVESAIIDHVGGGAVAARGGGAPGKLTVSGSSIRGVLRNGADTARGVEAGNGSHVTIEETTISGSEEHELLATSGATLEAKNVTTRGNVNNLPSLRSGTGLLASDKGIAKAKDCAFVAPFQNGVQAQLGGTIELDGAVVRDVVKGQALEAGRGNLGFGIIARSQSTLKVSRTWIHRASAVAVLSGGQSRVSLFETLVTDTQSNGGVGGRGMSLEEASVATVERSAFLGNIEVGLVAMEASTLAMTDSTVDGTRFDRDERFGIGALVFGGSTVTLDRTTLRASQGIGLAVDSAAVNVKAGFLARNAVAVHVQDGAELVEGAPGEAPTPFTVTISPETRFVENASRVGSGVVPLPTTPIR